MEHQQQSPEVAFLEEVAHTKVADCYQCGKCTAGCPMADEMDVIPSTLIRLVQYGDVEEAARTTAVWQCVSCQTCSTRCPKSVNIAGIIDGLKQFSYEHKLVHKKFRRVLAFQKAFLEIIRKNGRTNELELTVFYKLLAFFQDFSIRLSLKDANFALPMLMRKKLHIKMGGPVKDKALVKRIYKKCLKK